MNMKNADVAYYMRRKDYHDVLAINDENFNEMKKAIK